MVRYDRPNNDIKKQEVVEKLPVEYVTIDKEHMLKIANIFLESISKIVLKNTDIKIINSYTNEIIIFNNQVSLDDLSNTLGKKLNSKLEFIKEYYLYMIDNFTDQAYGRKVTAIQEFPYSFQSSPNNENLITYEFIK